MENKIEYKKGDLVRLMYTQEREHIIFLAGCLFEVYMSDENNKDFYWLSLVCDTNCRKYEDFDILLRVRNNSIKLFSEYFDELEYDFNHGDWDRGSEWMLSDRQRILMESFCYSEFELRNKSSINCSLRDLSKKHPEIKEELYQLIDPVDANEDWEKEVYLLIKKRPELKCCLCCWHCGGGMEVDFYCKEEIIKGRMSLDDAKKKSCDGFCYEDGRQKEYDEL